jgi:hypothetical protein
MRPSRLSGTDCVSFSRNLCFTSVAPVGRPIKKEVNQYLTRLFRGRGAYALRTPSQWAAFESRARKRFPSGSQTGNTAPDASRPVRDVSGLSQAPSRVGDESMSDRPVEISSVRLRLVRGDSMLTRPMGAQWMNDFREPIAIEVVTAQPLGNVERTASPEIYLDGARIGDTWPLPPDRLIMFVPDRQRLRAGMSITVAWLGSEERTRTGRPVTLTEDHLRELH